MKKFIFNNGETRLESQLKEGRSFKTSCILWGCFDEETKEPLPYTVHEATEEELRDEEIRLAEIREAYDEICELNAVIHLENMRILNSQWLRV